MHRRPSLLAATLSTLALGCAGAPAAAAPPQPAPQAITLAVDATSAPRALFKARLSVPAHPGDNVLVYPKWIPGEHAPTGPIVNVVGLRVTGAGRPLEWRRDSERMHELHVAVPAGVAAIDVELDVVSAPAEGSVFSGSAGTSERMMDLSWNQVVLYPKGARASAVTVTPTLRLPAGWSYATALTAASTKEGEVAFRPVTLETLVDSPVMAGANVKTWDLGTVHGAPHVMAVVAESQDALAASPETVSTWKHLAEEANALFGARHYDRYTFLVAASDHMNAYGLEHHASSQNHMHERVLLDEGTRRAFGDLISHEFVHSWNGKYRRPRGLATPDYQEPMRGDLLWVYEGLTEYLGWVLAARSGLVSEDDAKVSLARMVVTVDIPGRTWRPLVDTAVAAQMLYGASSLGRSLRRRVDYYQEGLLVWLDADVLIRQKTAGARSLDDFCQRFYGGKDGPAEVRPYDIDEVVRTLNEVVPHDWKGFFDERVYRVAPNVPLGGIEGAGYKLGYTEKKPEVLALREKEFKFTSYVDSLGFVLHEGVVDDVVEGKPAAKAGLVSGATLVAVNGRKQSPEALSLALAGAKATGAPIELLVERDDFYKTVRVDYREGERYRTIERVPSKQDVLAAILASKTRPATAK